MADELTTRVNDLVTTLTDKLNELSEPKAASFEIITPVDANSSSDFNFVTEHFNTGVIIFEQGSNQIGIEETGIYRISFNIQPILLSGHISLKIDGSNIGVGATFDTIIDLVTITSSILLEITAGQLLSIEINNSHTSGNVATGNISINKI